MTPAHYLADISYCLAFFNSGFSLCMCMFMRMSVCVRTFACTQLAVAEILKINIHCKVFFGFGIHFGLAIDETSFRVCFFPAGFKEVL